MRSEPLVLLFGSLWLTGCSLLSSGDSPPLLADDTPRPVTAAATTVAAGGMTDVTAANVRVPPAPPMHANLNPFEVPTGNVTPARLPLTAPEPEDLPPPPVDLITRLRDGFLLPQIDDTVVVVERNWYGSHPDYINRVFERGRRYLHHIAEALAERGMPADLALLPIVESAFDPFAYSRGRASGLWQIIPGTGDRLGLKQNWWYDGRRDIVDSTRAALDYLELLHAEFDGDWLLAVAGYNSGEGNVRRAIRRAEARGRPTDFWSIRDDLPAETAQYVPKLLAIRDLVADPAAFEIELPLIDDEPYFATVETAGQIDIALAADLGGIAIDALYELNPGINRWATDPEGPHRLFVPVADADQITAALAALAPSEQVRWTRHEIRRGETIGQIAEHYATTPAVLREINSLNGNLIRAGDYLMIPHASAAAGTYSQSMEARTARLQDRQRSGTRVDYRVRRGDSLWSIAQRYSVGTGELASWNAMAPGDVLSVGRGLVIWTDNAPAATVASLQGPAQVRRINYVVRRGDSLSSIAGRFRVSLDALLGWNTLSPDKYLQPGQSLVLYVDVTEQSS